MACGAYVPPGLHAAAEIQLARWFYFRSGVRYFFQHSNQRNATPDGDDISGQDNSAFAWNAGVGFETHGFQLNAALSNSFITAGPWFLSGNGGNKPLFTVVSAQYHW